MAHTQEKSDGTLSHSNEASPHTPPKLGSEERYPETPPSPKANSVDTASPAVSSDPNSISFTGEIPARQVEPPTPSYLHRAVRFKLPPSIPEVIKSRSVNPPMKHTYFSPFALMRESNKQKWFQQDVPSHSLSAQPPTNVEPTLAPAPQHRIHSTGAMSSLISRFGFTAAGYGIASSTTSSINRIERYQVAPSDEAQQAWTLKR